MDLYLVALEDVRDPERKKIEGLVLIEAESTGKAEGIAQTYFDARIVKRTKTRSQIVPLDVETQLPPTMKNRPVGRVELGLFWRDFATPQEQNSLLAFLNLRARVRTAAG